MVMAMAAAKPQVVVVWRRTVLRVGVQAGDLAIGIPADALARWEAMIDRIAASATPRVAAAMARIGTAQARPEPTTTEVAATIMTAPVTSTGIMAEDTAGTMTETTAGTMTDADVTTVTDAWTAGTEASGAVTGEVAAIMGEARNIALIEQVRGGTAQAGVAAAMTAKAAATADRTAGTTVATVTIALIPARNNLSERPTWMTRLNGSAPPFWIRNGASHGATASMWSTRDSVRRKTNSRPYYGASKGRPL